MSYSAEPGHVESFRDATDNHEKMRGAMFITFQCRECGKYKSRSGCKARGSKADGYRCAECHTKKTEKSAAVNYEIKGSANAD